MAEERKKIWKKRLRRWRKPLIALVGVGLFGLVSAFVLSEHVKNTTRERILSPEEASMINADCILVLGAGIRSDGSPCDMLRDRLDCGVYLYWQGAADKLLMSGDHSRRDYDEVNTMKNYAMSCGVASEDVFMDHAGFSTYESLYRARDIYRAKCVIIVTQEYHLYRALYNAQQLGIEAYGVASDPRPYAGQMYRDLREVLARCKDYFLCLAQPEPAFLGEVISITGDGNLTNG